MLVNRLNNTLQCQPLVSGGGAPAFSGLLDEYPSAAAAYSLRLLKSDFAGGLVEIAGYTTTPTFVENRTFLPDANNELSLTSQDVGLSTTLGAWITANSITDGYVRTWYDQSGNARDKVQTTASIQPQIIAASTILLSSGKPTVSYVSDYFPSVSGLEGNASISSFLVQESSDTQYVFVSEYGNRHGLINIAGTSTVLTSAYGSPDYYIDGTLTVFADRTAVNTLLSTGNPILRAEINGETSSWSRFDILNYYLGAWKYTGKASEMIFYLSDKTADVSGINTNINDYYSIY